MTPLGNLAVFSPDAALFAVVGTNSIRIFDSGNRRLVTILSDGTPAADANLSAAHSHSFEQYTSVSWGHDAAQVDGAGSKRSSRTIVVGTATGCVKAFDVSMGHLIWQATGVLEGGTTSLAAASTTDGAAFFAAGAEGRLVQLQAATGAVQASWQGGRHALTALAAAAANSRLVLSSATVTVWDAAEQKRLFKFSGHAVGPGLQILPTIPVQPGPADLCSAPLPARPLPGPGGACGLQTSATAVASTADGRYAVSAAAGDRHIAVWNATGKPGKKVKTASASLAMEASAVAVEVCSTAGGVGEASLLVAAVTEHGEALVWRCIHSAQAEAGSGGGRLLGELLLQVRGRRSTESEAASIVAAKLDVGSDGSASLLVARGAAKPTFERLAVPALGEALAQITLDPLQGGALLRQATVPAASQPPPASGSKSGHPLVLGAENAGSVVQQRPLAAAQPAPSDAAASKKRRRPLASALDSTDAALPNGAIADEAGSGDEEDGAARESTLGERVAALRVADSAAPLADAVQPAEDGTITADSLSVLLTQALRSEDRSLLERCLNISNSRIIENTVRRLATVDVALFLRAAVQRLQSAPARGQELHHWIRALLLQHTAYLMSAPGAQPALSALYQSVQARRASHEALLSLSGRLELVRAQLDKAVEGANTQIQLEPQVVYCDDDEDAARDEAGSDSEGWETDNEPDLDDQDSSDSEE